MAEIMNYYIFNEFEAQEIKVYLKRAALIAKQEIDN